MSSHAQDLAVVWSKLNPRVRAEIGRALRRRGLSYSEIREIIPVPKSTLAGWCSDVELTAAQQAAIWDRTRLVPGSRRDTQWRRRARVAAIQSEAGVQAAELRSDPAWTAGVYLYWAEGDKTGRNFAMSNSDPALLRTFIWWVRRYLVDEPEFMLSLHLHAGGREAISKTYWREALRLPDASFWTTQWKSPGTGQRKKRLDHGVCRVYVRRGTDAWLRTLAWIDALRESDWPEDPAALLSSSPGR